MATMECLSAIRKATGLEDMTDDEAERMLGKVFKEAERIKGARALGAGEAATVAAKELADRVKAAAAADRLRALQDAGKREAVMTRVDTEGAIGKAYRTLRSVMYFDIRSPSYDNIQSLWHGRSKQWQALMSNELRSSGLLELARSGHLDHETSEAVWRANGNAPDANVNISTDAQKIADIIKPYLDKARNELNAEGAQVNNTVDLLDNRNWNSRQLRRAAGRGATMDQAFEAWWAADGSRMAEKTFEDIEPAKGQTQAEAEKAFGHQFFEEKVTGIHGPRPYVAGMLDEGVGDFIPPAFEGTRNIARGISQPRVIYWKNATAWADHMREFGGGDGLYTQVMRTLDTAARQSALMRYLGTNPAASLNMIIDRIQQKYRSDIEGVMAFQRRIKNLQNVMGRLDGTLNRPVNERLTNLTEALMTEEMMAHLGAVQITHILAAPATVTSELVHHGVPRIAALGETIKAVLGAVGSRPRNERQQILADAGAYAHSYQTAIKAKLQPDSGIPGFASWAGTNFMRLTGLHRFLDQFHAEGVEGVLMARLGRAAKQTMDRLDPEQAGILRRYGIDEAGWDALRSGGGTVAEGQRYLSPSHALQAPGLTEREAQHLADRYLMYLNDAAEHSTVTAGVRERAAVMGSSQPGTVDYMMKRFLLQFKMWSIAAVNQIIARELFASLSVSQKAVNIGWLLAFSGGGGALRMMIRDAAAGRPQQDYSHPLTLLKALAQGGGLGIYGDFLFGEANREGGLAATFGGPLIGTGEQLVKMFNRFKDDLKTHPGKAMQHMYPDLAHLMVNHIPFGNLPYLKGALDYLLWYHLFEAASPGWWQRTNRRLQKEQGRTMAGYTPGGQIPWTPYGLGANP